MCKEIIKPLVSIIVVLLGSCSTILEVEEQQNNERIVKEPSVVSQLDSVSFIRVKSTIQASSSALLANSMVYRDGSWSLDITVEEADSLGVSKRLYVNYLSIIKELKYPNNSEKPRMP